MYPPSRVGAIQGELERAVAEYIAARDDYERARVSFETACERYGAVKRLASEMLNPHEWFTWQNGHQNVRFAAMLIGEAITDLLRQKAFDSAYEVAVDPAKQYHPALSVLRISEALEAGGFKFSSTSPLREVNAALMRLKGIKQLRQGIYQIEQAEEILDQATEVFSPVEAEVQQELSTEEETK